jgi:hypothetical protein
MHLTLTFDELLDCAAKTLAKDYPQLEGLEKVPFVFKKRYFHESDGDAYDLPDYVEIKI